MTKDFPVTIYHNPACGTSRNALALLREEGLEPTVVEYLKAGWTREQLTGLAAKASVPLSALIRERGTPAEAMGLLEPGVGDEVILGAMIALPILVNRPIVDTPKGAALCRPAETVRELL